MKPFDRYNTVFVSAAPTMSKWAASVAAKVTLGMGPKRTVIVTLGGSMSRTKTSRECRVVHSCAMPKKLPRVERERVNVQ